MKKVLIITYYWPPMGGGGVQRWLKFTKYMREFGWEPVIYTPLDADIANMDSSLLKEVPAGIEVVKRKIWEPFDLYKKFTGKSKGEKVQPGFLQESESVPLFQKIAVWIRGNLFIPDAKFFWIRPSVKFLNSYIPSNQIQAVISTGPPHSNHLIAMKLKQKLGIKWLADFRDPWTNIDYYDKLMLTSFADARHRKLEKQVLRSADEVVTVSWSWADDFFKSSGRRPVVVTNGYDPEDFLSVKADDYNDKFTITHIGSLNRDRNPYIFWKALSCILNENPEWIKKLKIRFIGPTDISVFQEVKKFELSDVFEHIPHLTHREVLTYTVKSDLLLLPLNNTPNIGGVIPGKLYEYLASRRPILCIGKISGDAAMIISETKSGQTFDFNDVDGLKLFLERHLSEIGRERSPDNSLVSEKYSRKNLTGKICELLDKMTT